MAFLFPTVSETFVLHHVTGLLDLGVEVDIYAERPEAVGDCLHHELTAYRLLDRLTHFPSVLEGSPAGEQIVQRRYDAIHCHFGEIAERFAFLKERLPDTRFVATFHGRDVRRGQEEGGRIYGNVFRSFDRIASICDYNAALLTDMGCPPDKLIALPNGVDTVRFSPEERPASGAIRILSVARLHPDKNIDFALRVMSRLRTRGIAFHYTVAGHGHGRRQEEIEGRIRGYGLEGHVTLLGQCSQERIVDALRTADVFFLPSRAEAAPVCVLEAQATELPVVATRVGGVGELVAANEAGFLIESEDEGAAEDALIRLSADVGLRREMGARGRVRVAQRYEHRSVGRRCLAAYGIEPTPRVSVVVPSCGDAFRMGQALDRVLLQTEQRFELIVVGAGADEEVRAAVADRQARHPGALRFLRGEAGRVADAKQLGRGLARGALVIDLDPEDDWEPGELAGRVAALEAGRGRGGDSA